MHRARNPQYIDRNYAGVLTAWDRLGPPGTAWDRLFGSFVPGEAVPVFGITRPIRSHHPTTLTFHEWRDMWADVFRDRDLRYLWKPPEWRSPGAGRLRRHPGSNPRPESGQKNAPTDLGAFLSADRRDQTASSREARLRSCSFR
uniref:Uncharacterized protein n=1 Tax=Ralstonia solanacearum TaxID=305 RepID=A0A0S4TXC7_RALSL|nr:protein of unknown function [Ralstonia solanacearum]